MVHADTLLEMEEVPFFTLEHPNITIIPALQKLGKRTPDKFMAILWNLGVDSLSIKRHTTIGYLKRSNFVEKSQNEQENIGKLLR